MRLSLIHIYRYSKILMPARLLSQLPVLPFRPPKMCKRDRRLLVYGRFCHTWLCFQKILQGVRLVKAHSGLPHMHPDSPGNFVFDFKVHFFSTPLIRFALFQKTGLRQKGRRRLRLRPPLP